MATGSNTAVALVDTDRSTVLDDDCGGVIAKSTDDDMRSGVVVPLDDAVLLHSDTLWYDVVMADVEIVVSALLLVLDGRGGTDSGLFGCSSLMV